MKSITAVLGILLLGGLFVMVAAIYSSSAASAADSVSVAPKGAKRAIFAGGCFWCMEKPFEVLDGVYAVTSGYVGGHKLNPTYKEVSAGITGHTEAVLVEYDPERVSYATLLEVFWRNVDPTDAGGQFCDRGSQYRTGIFPTDDEQAKLARASRDELNASDVLPHPVVTEITPAGTFWPAEGYHQDYYKENPVRYKFYRYNCGRDQRLEELWGTK